MVKAFSMGRLNPFRKIAIDNEYVSLEKRGFGRTKIRIENIESMEIGSAYILDNWIVYILLFSSIFYVGLYLGELLNLDSIVFSSILIGLIPFAVIVFLSQFIYAEVYIRTSLKEYRVRCSREKADKILESVRKSQ